MKNILLPLILLLPLYALAQTQNPMDSLWNIVASAEGQEKIDACTHLANIYFIEYRNKQKRDTLFALYDKIETEAERIGNDHKRGMLRAEKLQTLNYLQQYDEVIKLAPEYFEFVERRQLWSSYYLLYNQLINAYRLKRKSDEALDLAQKMYEHAKVRKDNAGTGVALFAMANIYKSLFRPTEQEEFLRDCIALIQDSASVVNIWAEAHIQLGVSLVAQERFDEAIRTADELETVIQRYEEITGSPQPYTRYMHYNLYLDAYRQSEQNDKAEMYCDKIDSLRPGEANTYEARASILLSRKQYDEALVMANKAIDATEQDRRSSVLQRMSMKMMVLLYKKDSEAGDRMFRDILIMMDSIQNSKLNAKIDEIHTQYEVDKINTEKARIRNYLYFTLGGCLLLAVLLGIYIYYSWLIRNKNRGLYRQIKEQDRLAEELENERNKSRKLQLLNKPDDLEFSENDDEVFFGKLTLLMKKQRLFTDVDIKRQDIAKQIGLSDRRLHDCIKNSTGMNFTEYINELRLSYSRELLSQKGKKYTIDAIALDAGFNSRTTFYRLFREKYGLSPEEFRKYYKINA